VAVRFVWDARKAVHNQRKHGVSFEEAVSTFRDSLSITIPDPDHSMDEERLLLLGLSDRGKLLVTAHTERGEEIRLISARSATRRERRIYEEADG